MSLEGDDMVVKLELLRKITNNFSEAQKVGSGGYGDVYRAMYNGEEIAVKKFHQDLERLDDKEFDNEVLNLREIQHQNIVRLLGYCYVSHHMYVDHNGGIVRAEHIERLLCIEYMEGGSLEKHISDESCDLDWRTSFKIIRGICEGLNHLHTTKGKPIYHLDLKPANILLDKNKTAKIGDLGLSNLATSTKNQRPEDRKGTKGYMPPEYIKDGVVSNKFDVFSLGVIIIKMLAGNTGYDRRHEMPPERFIEFVTEKWKEKLQGTKVYLSQESDILQLKTCVDIALRCVKDERNERPDVKGIVNELEKLEPQIDKISTDPDYYRSGVSQDIRQKEHLFHLYMTQRGAAPSNEKVAVQCFGFGTIGVSDFTIRDGPAPNANLVGRARGMLVCDGMGDDHWLFCHSIVFTDTRFKGSSLKMLGDFVCENDAGWAIVGGTGEFAYANGAVTAKVIQRHTAATGRIWDLRIRAFCLCVSEKTTMGPWDREAGAAFDIPETEPPRCLQTVTIGYGEVINSIAFSYTNEAGEKKTAGPWGSHGALTRTIMLAPSEIIKQVLGTTSTVGKDTVVTSLILVSNLTTYGPFGTTNGTPFCSEDPESNKSIAGFYARAGEAVNALGVYYTPEN
ncbi:hypothetical protein U9M48_000947 [Paspalum notatum var. saurae]|uniref:Dirigent protein n=1 Tax=Paspalum notatum var. saurae TaxID=547442 RepID=A0AAQ3SEV5_PASNO